MKTSEGTADCAGVMRLGSVVGRCLGVAGHVAADTRFVMVMRGPTPEAFDPALDGGLGTLSRTSRRGWGVGGWLDGVWETVYERHRRWSAGGAWRLRTLSGGRNTHRRRLRPARWACIDSPKPVKHLLSGRTRLLMVSEPPRCRPAPWSGGRPFRLLPGPPAAPSPSCAPLTKLLTQKTIFETNDPTRVHERGTGLVGASHGGYLHLSHRTEETAHEALDAKVRRNGQCDGRRCDDSGGRRAVSAR